jgi:hypothetical protein
LTLSPMPLWAAQLFCLPLFDEFMNLWVSYLKLVLECRVDCSGD